MLHGARVKHQYRQDMEAMFIFLCQHQRETGFPPSLREMADAFYMSPGTIMRYLDKMEAKGWIAREWGKARGITILRVCSPWEDGSK